MSQALRITGAETQGRPRLSPRLLDESIMKEPQVAAQFEELLSAAREKGVDREVCGIIEMYMNAMDGQLPLTLSRRLKALLDATPADHSARVLDACASLMKQSPMAAEHIPAILADLPR